MKQQKAFGSTLGLSILKDNPANPAAGMVARISNTVPGCFQIGDQRLTALCDVTPEVITAPATVADRSIKNMPLTLTGTLSKSAVATAAQLQSYSGFSAANYLSAPGFATGGFLYGWQLNAGAWEFKTGAALDGVTETAGTIRIQGTLPKALVRYTMTVPSADQLAFIERTERALFQPSAQCVIDGTSAAVTALAYNDDADLLHVGTSWGRTAFQGLRRVESAVTTSGAITTIAAGQGAHITGGASSGRYYQPAMYLREELRRKAEARAALGKVPTFLPFAAIAAQVAFPVPKGFTVKAVYSAGLLKTAGTTGDRYSVSFDGFAETVTFLVAPGAGVDVQFMCVRA